MKTRLSIFLIISLLVSCFVSCRQESENTCADIKVETDIRTLLEETEDMGQDYIDSLIFIGESTTYHMKNRGVLRGGENTKQIWAPECGTVNLDMGTKNIKIRYPDTDELLTYAEAAARKKPKYIIFTFGLNGAVNNVKRGENYYRSCYLSLINSVREASPETRIILQSAFPVASNMDMSKYSVSLETLNESIDIINQWSLSLAEDEGLRYLNTAEVLKDDTNMLKYEFQAGDGHHLTTEAYRVILSYIRTHGYR